MPPVSNSPSEAPSSSPVPKKRELLDFPDAVRKIIEGKKVTKEEWNDEKKYGHLAHGFLCIHTDEDHTWNVNDGDLLGKDYYVIE